MSFLLPEEIQRAQAIERLLDLSAVDAASTQILQVFIESGAFETLSLSLSLCVSMNLHLRLLGRLLHLRRSHGVPVRNTNVSVRSLHIGLE